MGSSTKKRPRPTGKPLGFSGHDNGDVQKKHIQFSEIFSILFGSTFNSMWNCIVLWFIVVTTNLPFFLVYVWNSPTPLRILEIGVGISVCVVNFLVSVCSINFLFGVVLYMFGLKGYEGEGPTSGSSEEILVPRKVQDYTDSENPKSSVSEREIVFETDSDSESSERERLFLKSIRTRRARRERLFLKPTRRERLFLKPTRTVLNPRHPIQIDVKIICKLF